MQVIVCLMPLRGGCVDHRPWLNDVWRLRRRCLRCLSLLVCSCMRLLLNLLLRLLGGLDGVTLVRCGCRC